MSSYKYCIVPMCESTSMKYPEKLFLRVPDDEGRRKKWMHAMKRQTPMSANSKCYVCEDHFDIPNDTENYVRYKLMGGSIFKKKNAVPHIFNCQKKRILPARQGSEIRKRKAMVNELLLQNEQSTTDRSRIPEPSALLRMHQGSKAVVEEQHQSPQEKQDNIPREPAVRIKDELADDYPAPFTSNDTASGEFIFSHIDRSWTTPNSVVIPQLTLSVASLNTNQPVTSDSGPLKTKQRTNSSGIITNASASTVVSNHTAIRPQSPASEDVSTLSSSKELCKNPFDGFGNYVANKLNSLDSLSSARAQKAIESIILEAEMGNYRNETEDIKPSIVPFSI